MENVFSTLRNYPGNWKVVSERNFTDEEKAMVKEVITIQSDWGISAVFKLKDGSKSYIPLSTMSELSCDEVLDIDNIKLLTLERDGQTIYRIE